MDNNLLVQQNVGMGNNPFTIFDYNNLGKVRVQIGPNGEPWFCLVDVCEILTLTNPSKVAQRIIQNNEVGLYQAIG